MRYRCVTCGIEFDTIEQLAAHKRQHQQASPGNKPPGIICLGCGRGITLGPSQINYSGPLKCPHCNRTMKVVIENGEVCVARFG